MATLVFCGDRGVPALGPSGASAHLRAIARALNRVDSVVVGARARDQRGEHGSLGPIPLMSRAPRSWSWLRGWRERGETWDARRLIEHAVTGRRIDAIWERHSLFVDAGMRLQGQLGVPRVVELNAPLSRERPGVRDRDYAARVERASLLAATRVLAVSSWLARWAVEDVGVPADRVQHLPNGTEVQPGDRDRSRARHALSGQVAVWVGSCKAWHGLHRLPALADALADWTIAVAGDGPVPVPEHPRIRSLGRLEGPDLDDLLAAADVGLATGDPDTMPWVCPLKILDYRAAGLPVVATASGDSALLVDRGEVLTDWSPQSAAAAVRHWAGQSREPAVRTWDQVVSESRSGWAP